MNILGEMFLLVESLLEWDEEIEKKKWSHAVQVFLIEVSLSFVGDFVFAESHFLPIPATVPLAFH